MESVGFPVGLNPEVAAVAAGAPKAAKAAMCTLAPRHGWHMQIVEEHGGCAARCVRTEQVAGMFCRSTEAGGAYHARPTHVDGGLSICQVEGGQMYRLLSSFKCM